jgi:hypothetical protein
MNRSANSAKLGHRHVGGRLAILGIDQLFPNPMFELLGGATVLDGRYALHSSRSAILPQNLDVDVPGLALDARGVGPPPPTDGHQRLPFCRPPWPSANHWSSTSRDTRMHRPKRRERQRRKSPRTQSLDRSASDRDLFHSQHRRPAVARSSANGHRTRVHCIHIMHMTYSAGAISSFSRSLVTASSPTHAT